MRPHVHTRAHQLFNELIGDDLYHRWLNHTLENQEYFSHLYRQCVIYVLAGEPGDNQGWV